MSNRAKITALAFMALSVAHALMGFLHPTFPAWKMFRVVPQYRYELIDAQGAPILVHDTVQNRAYVMSSPVFVLQIAQWIVETSPERAPVTGSLTAFTEAGEVTRAFQVVPGPDGAQVLERN